MSNNILFLSNIKGNFEKVIESFKNLEKTGKKFDVKLKIFIFNSSQISSVLKYKIKYKTFSFLII